MPAAVTPRRDPERYDIVGEHGRGGRGKVSRAHDRDLGRDVAIKELIARDPISEVRFVRESLITARLQHPGIVPVYEAGHWRDGTPFYAMKLVAGRPLRDLLAERVTVEDRLDLLHHVIAVADAIAYAHDHHIIHRDLKPANIIIGDFGETIVIDWGLAKDITSAEDPGVDGAFHGHDGDLTSTGSVLGTPAYMAPEQRRGEPVDQRADVYAIGRMLWELCSLQREPPAEPQLRRRALRRAGIDGDLVAIVDKSLASEPRERYGDAAALAADLKAFKSGVRITARSYSLLALLRHWTRRHRALALSVLAFTIVAVAGVAALAVLYRMSSRNAAEARDRLVQSYLEQGRRLSLASDYLRALPYLAQAYAEGDRSVAVRVLLARAERLAGLSRGIYRHTGSARAAAFRPDGTHVLSVSELGEAVIWDAATGRAVAAMPPPPPPAEPRGLRTVSSQISRDGAYVAVPAPDGVKLWDGARVRTMGPPGAERVAIDASGERIAVTAGGELSTWRVATGERLWAATLFPGGAQVGAIEGSARPAAVSSIAWSGERVVVLGTDKLVRIAGAGGVSTLATPAAVDSISVGSAGGIAAITGSVVELWDATGARGAVLDRHRRISVAAFSRDGRRIAVAGNNGIVRLYEAGSGAELGDLVGHRGAVRNIAFTPDGARLATTGYDLTLRIWDVADQREVVTLRGPPDQPIAAGLRIDASGDRVAIPTDDGAVYVFATADPDVELSVDAGEAVKGVAFLDGERFTTRAMHAARVWSVATGRELARFDAPGADYITLSPDGTKLAVMDGDTTHVELQDSATRRVLARLACSEHFRQVGFDDASARVATTCNNVLEVWDTRGQRVARLEGHRDRINPLAFSSDNRRMLSGSSDHTTRIWDLATGRELGRMTTTGTVTAVDFDATGTRIVTASSDRIARIWDIATLQPLRSFEHETAVFDAKLSGDGRLLATGARDGIVALWDAETSTLVAELRHSAQVNELGFSPDGRHLVSAGSSGRAIVSRVELETRSPDEVAAFVRCHVPYRLVGTRLESATPSCDRD